ncbi:MAG: IclR family transcriptional regulator [Clostridia bacterium]|nr:IclR family transcriptional regulator [Candidatus Pelethousia sp.]NCB30071.1 IclR family transcriptional regulator [Clostridia bacterium]
MQLIERTLSMLEILSRETNGLSVSDAAARLDISSSAAHRILQALTQQAYVYQDKDTKRYQIGYKVLTLCANITQENSLIRTSHAYLRELEQKLHRTIALCVRKCSSIICIDYADSGDGSMFYIRTGFAMPLHSTSAGKILCSYLERDKVRALLESAPSLKHTPYTETNYDEWIRELDGIQHQGYALCDEELQLGVQGIATAVFDGRGKAIASISFTALKADQSITPESIGILKEYAGRISRALGHQQI